MNLEEKLQQYPSYLKKGNKWLSKKFKVPEEDVQKLREKYRISKTQGKTKHYVSKEKEEKDGGITIRPEHPMSLEELCREYKIDTEGYFISDYYVKTHKGSTAPTYTLHPKLNSESLIIDFHKFLKDYSPSAPKIPSPYPVKNRKCSVVFNKQDFHVDKYSTDESNGITSRFLQYEQALDDTFSKLRNIYDVEEVLYIIGADAFNSEWTGTTVKGTPQQNIKSYHTVFELMCDHEVNIIYKMLENSEKVNVIYCIGNHDMYVSYHMVGWLKTYFRENPRVVFDVEMKYTKYKKVYDTAICINHGDVQKPEQLVQNFPIEFKEHWSECSHYAVFLGDKHSELTKDVGGVKVYRIPALSTAISRWDEQNGYTTNKSEMTTFVIEDKKGISMILKEWIQ